MLTLRDNYRQAVCTGVCVHTVTPLQFLVHAKCWDSCHCLCLWSKAGSFAHSVWFGYLAGCAIWSRNFIVLGLFCLRPQHFKYTLIRSLSDWIRLVSVVWMFAYYVFTFLQTLHGELPSPLATVSVILLSAGFIYSSCYLWPALHRYWTPHFETTSVCEISTDTYVSSFNS